MKNEDYPPRIDQEYYVWNYHRQRAVIRRYAGFGKFHSHNKPGETEEWKNWAEIEKQGNLIKGELYRVWDNEGTGIRRYSGEENKFFVVNPINEESTTRAVRWDNYTEATPEEKANYLRMTGELKPKNAPIKLIKGELYRVWNDCSHEDIKSGKKPLIRRYSGEGDLFFNVDASGKEHTTETIPWDSYTKATPEEEANYLRETGVLREEPKTTSNPEKRVKSNPWRPHELNTWPPCSPDDFVECDLWRGKVITGKATEMLWGYIPNRPGNEIAFWRLAEKPTKEIEGENHD
jgi:hypothetical protein